MVGLLSARVDLSITNSNKLKEAFLSSSCLRTIHRLSSCHSSMAHLNSRPYSVSLRRFSSSFTFLSKLTLANRNQYKGQSSETVWRVSLHDPSICWVHHCTPTPRHLFSTQETVQIASQIPCDKPGCRAIQNGFVKARHVSLSLQHTTALGSDIKPERCEGSQTTS